MKIATNITRSNVGGITVSNINFLNSIHQTGRGVVGIELMPNRFSKGATAFRHFSPEWFDHNVVNTFDKPIFKVIENAKNLAEVKKEYTPIIKTIKKILKNNSVNVVFLNGTYYIPWLIAIAAHDLKIPIVLRYAGIYSREMGHMDISEKEKKIYLEIERNVLHLADNFIFPSQICLDVVEQEVAINKEDKASLKKNSFVIPNPVKVPDKIKKGKNKIKSIAAIGRWDPIKNFQAFFKIHRLLLKEGWVHQAKFLTSAAKFKGLPTTIERIKSVPHDKIFNFYANQDIVISPSYFETFGNVPMEAACLGVPVLVSETMGCADVLKKVGLDNMIISFDDPILVSQKVKELCGKKIPKKQVNALRKILDPKNINLKILEVLNKALSKSKKSKS